MGAFCPRYLTSRCTVSGEKAGKHTAMYSAPSAPRRAVSHPFAAANDDRLSGVDLMNCFASFHLQFTAQDDHVLVKLRRLPRLVPTARARHLRDAKYRCP